MLNEPLGLKTVGLSQDMDETCRAVYGEFLRRFDLQGKWQLVVRGVDPDRIIVQSISPTGNERHYLDRIAPDSHFTRNHKYFNHGLPVFYRLLFRVDGRSPVN